MGHMFPDALDRARSALDTVVENAAIRTAEV